MNILGCPWNSIIQKYNLPTSPSDKWTLTAEYEQLYRYETKSTLPYMNIKNFVTYDLDKEKTGIIYVPHVNQMKELIEIAKSKGINAIGIWSKTNEDHDMDKDQRYVWDYIVEQEKIPPKYNLIFINASCGTSINIESKYDYKLGYMVINHSGSDTIEQVRGRVRGDLDLLFLPDKTVSDFSVFEIPTEFIGTPLNGEQRKLLCDTMPIYDKRGRKTAWTTLKRQLVNFGYIVTSKEIKINGKRKTHYIINIK